MAHVTIARSPHAYTTSIEIYTTAALPMPVNPLGGKGIGQAATIGATPTVTNAVIDALSALAVTHLDVSFTSEKV